MKLQRSLRKDFNAVTPVLAASMVLLIVSSTVGTIVMVGVPYVESLEDERNRQFIEQQWDSIAESIGDLIGSNTGEGETFNINPNKEGTISISEAATDKTIISYAFDNDYNFTVANADNNQIQINMIGSGSFDTANIYWFNFNENCFLEGTKVVMADGSYKNIEDIVVGDLVLAYDESTGVLANCKVDHTFYHTPEEMTEYYLVINDNLKVTPNHRFYSDGKWIYAGDLQIGSYLLTKELEDYVISSVEKVYEKVPTYDLEIEHYHTFFVSVDNDADVLVHNVEFRVQFITSNPFCSIVFNGENKNNGDFGDYLPGWYDAYVVFGQNYIFSEWTASPTINFGSGSEYSPVASVEVTGAGSIQANFIQNLVGAFPIDLIVDPIEVGPVIMIGATGPYGNVQLSRNTGTYTCSVVNVPPGYSFERWYTTGNVYVTDSYYASTTLILNGAGSLRASFIVDDNEAPVAVPDVYSVAAGGTLSVSTPGVLTNDYDPDEDPLTAVLVSGPSSALNFQFYADGSFDYTHDSGGSGGSGGGSDSFTYKANDGKTDSQTVTVTININPSGSPIAYDDYYTTYGDTALIVSSPGVLANDVDDDPLIAVQIGGAPNNGTLEILNANGGFTYIPDNGFIGIDSFAYIAIDTENNPSDPTLVYITVNNPPATPTISGPDPPKLEADYSYSFTASTSDPDGHNVYYWFDWGDGNNSGWLGPYVSGNTCNRNHAWSNDGSYNVKVKAKDTYGTGTIWSNILTVTVGPVLAVSTTQLNFESSVNNGNIVKSFNVLNDGVGLIQNVYITEQNGELITLISPERVNVSTSGVQIYVTINTDEFESGRYTSYILIDAGAYGQKTVSIKLAIFEPHSGSTSSSEGVQITSNTITTPGLPFAGTVAIDLLDATGNHVGSIWIFESNSIKYEASSGARITKLIIEHGGIIDASSNREYVHAGPRIMNNEQMLSFSIIQTVMASNSYLSSTSALGKLKTDLLGSATDRYDLKKSSAYGVRIQFYGNHTSAWSEFFSNHGFKQEDSTDNSVTLLYKDANNDGTQLILWHSYVEVSLLP